LLKNSLKVVILSYTARVYGILTNYQAGFGYKLTNGWYARSDSPGTVYECTQTQSTQA